MAQLAKSAQSNRVRTNRINGSKAAAWATPISAKAVLQKQGEHAVDRDGVNASIQYARHDGRWVAEFRFALRSGLYWACTLPLTTSSDHFATEAGALAHAARRLLDSLASAIDGDRLAKAQQKSVDALEAKKYKANQA